MLWKNLIFCLILGSGILSAASAQESEWSVDKPVDVIPEAPLHGQIFGREFKLESATINNIALTLSSPGKPWPDGKLMIFIGTDKLKDELVVTPDSEGNVPHIHMKFTRPGRNSRAL